MARRGRRGRGALRRVPEELRPIVGGAVLVAAVRTVDLLWRRIGGRPTPVGPHTSDAATDAVRDRLLYAALLGGALRLARRLGLPKDAADRTRDGRNGRSPA